MRRRFRERVFVEWTGSSVGPLARRRSVYAAALMYPMVSQSTALAAWFFGCRPYQWMTSSTRAARSDCRGRVPH